MTDPAPSQPLMPFSAALTAAEAAGGGMIYLEPPGGLDGDLAELQCSLVEVPDGGWVSVWSKLPAVPLKCDQPMDEL